MKSRINIRFVILLLTIITIPLNVAAKPSKWPFTHYYTQEKWETHQSGGGSDNIQTKIIQRDIPRIVKEFNIKTFADAACGDYFWMRNVKLEINKYYGFDIIPNVIKHNREKYGDENHIFEVRDLTSQVAPRVDLILCRDVFVHFSYSDIRKALRNVKKSKSTYLLTTTFPTRSRNQNIKTGSWRPLNLQAPPFNFPKPLAVINEGCMQYEGRFADKSLSLWSIRDLSI